MAPTGSNHPKFSKSLTILMLFSYFQPFLADSTGSVNYAPELEVEFFFSKSEGWRFRGVIFSPISEGFREEFLKSSNSKNFASFAIFLYKLCSQIRHFVTIFIDRLGLFHTIVLCCTNGSLGFTVRSLVSDKMSRSSAPDFNNVFKTQFEGAQISYGEYFSKKNFRK